MARNKSFDQQDILDKAKELFWQKGYYATSIQDLVDHIGLNRSSIYHSFGDKHKLFKAVLKKYRQESFDQLIEKLNQDKPVKEILTELFNETGSEYFGGDSKGCFMVKSTMELSSSDPFVQEISSLNKASVQKSFEQLVEKGKASGEITSNLTSQALGSHFFNSYVGLRVLGSSGMSNKELQNIISVTLSVLE